MKKALYIIPAMLSALALISCGKDKVDGKGFEKFNNIIAESEKSFIKFNETDEIKDPSMNKPVYSKVSSFEVTRGESVSTEVAVKELRLSNDGSGLAAENSFYKTYGEKKIETIGGKKYETEYKVPSYFLTFIPKEEYFAEGYTLTDSEGKMSLEASVKPDMITSFFANKSFIGVSDLNVKIETENDKLTSFKANYKTKSNKEANISVSYVYPIEIPKGEKDLVDATFYLEGGYCGDITEKVEFAYDFNGRHEMQIYDPNELKEGTVTKPDHHIEGWYKTKKVDDMGNVTYEDKFDFENDKMDRNGLTLYARWMENIDYTYGVYYKDAQGKDVKLGEYKVEPGEQFQDHRKLANKLKDVNLTSLGYLDADGNPWNKNFTHPGGSEKKNEVRVYLDTIEGVYKIVSSYNDLRSGRRSNIYLADDINCNNKEFSFGEYKNTLLGNGHKISNVKIKFDAGRGGLEEDIFGSSSRKSNLYIGLFRKLENARVERVTFENITADIKIKSNSLLTNIVIAPFAIESKNSTIENVSFIGQVTLHQTPSEFETIVVTDELIYNSDDATKINNSEFNIKLIDNRK